MKKKNKTKNEKKKKNLKYGSKQPSVCVWKCTIVHVYYTILCMYFILVIEAAIDIAVVVVVGVALAVAVVVTLNLFNLYIYTKPISVYIFRIFYMGIIVTLTYCSTNKWQI